MSGDDHLTRRSRHSRCAGEIGRPGSAGGAVPGVRDARVQPGAPHAAPLRRRGGRAAGDVLEVVRSIKQYRGEGHLWGWVRQITVSKTLMRIRRGQLRDTEELHEEYTQGGSGLGVGGVPARIDLERAFERLTPTSRAVVWWHDVEGYTHEEIAERMERTVSFSKSQLARAHARLRRLLAEEGAAQ